MKYLKLYETFVYRNAETPEFSKGEINETKFSDWKTGTDIFKDREELIEIFKWISNNKYDGVYPNFQLWGTPGNIVLLFQRFGHEPQFLVEDWLIDGVKYVMQVYGYKYRHMYHNSKPVSVSFETANPDYDEIADLLDDDEGVFAGGESRQNSNKNIMSTKSFDNIDSAVGLEVNTLSIYISKANSI